MELLGIDSDIIHPEAASALGLCLRPPTVVRGLRVSSTLGLVSTAEKGTKEEEKMQGEQHGGKGKSRVWEPKL